jgi:hypothetical protein
MDGWIAGWKRACFWSIPFTMIIYYFIYMVCMALQGGDIGKVYLKFLYQGSLINFDANRYDCGPVYGLLGITISKISGLCQNDQRQSSNLVRNL